MRNDTVWLRGERAPRRPVEITSERLATVGWTAEDGSKHEVKAWTVRSIERDRPRELEEALALVATGDYAGAEKALAAVALLSSTAWVGVHAAFVRANARRLRARLEGTGHDEAHAWLSAWLEKNPDHFLTPGAFVAAGDAALRTGDVEKAKSWF